jgi:hypothetical protein
MTEPDDVTASRAWEPGLRSISEPGVPLFMNVTLTINPERQGWRDLVEYRDVILQKPYFQAYLQISESTYAKPRVTQPLIPVQTDS